MDSSNLLEDIGGGIKIEAESDSVFFGLNSTIMATPHSPPSSLTLDGGGNMDCQHETSAVNSFLASDIADLDFDLLQDLPLPVDDLNLLDDILMNEDSNSNSFSSESYVLDSIADSPPLTPPSPTYSSSSSSSQLGHAEIKLEPASPLGMNCVIQADTNQLKPNSNRSARGRSASIEAPEVQALKRHIRMIRNRESACMSRKKKKDYVTGVENRVKELEAENAALKQENASLKKRLQELGQGLPVANGTAAPARILVTTSPMVKTAPAAKLSSPRPKIIKINTKLPATAAKIVLLGFCCFMFVTLRPPVADDNSITNSTHPMSKVMISSDGLIPRSFIPSTSNGGKSSLTYESERHVDPDEDYTLIKEHESRGLWDNFRLGENYLDKNESKLNATLSGTRNATNPRADTIHHRKLSKGVRSEPASNVEDPTDQLRRRPKYANETLDSGGVDNCALFNQTEAMRVQNRLKGIFGKPEKARRKPAHVHKPIVYSLIDSTTKPSDNKGLTVYDEKIRQYSKIFDQLERREDTFYVISLAIENQILFSAKAHNVTSRPKMSFLLPWRNETRGGKEELMQIDCEVTGVFSLNKPARNTG